MSKDPAFLFYHEDFFAGVSDMSNDEVGAYIRCMCIQASKGGITEKHMKKICESHEIFVVVVGKFIFNSDLDFYENKRLKEESEKRKAYSKSRSENRSKKNKPANTSLSYEKHMENENEVVNKNTDEIKNEKLLPVVKEKIDYQQIIDIFNSHCTELPKVMSLSDKRKKMIDAIVKDFELESIGKVFQNIIESDFLNGKSNNGWTANFDWIFNKTNFLKILEGNYKKTTHNPQEEKFKKQVETLVSNSQGWNVSKFQT